MASNERIEILVSSSMRWCYSVVLLLLAVVGTTIHFTACARVRFRPSIGANPGNDNAEETAPGNIDHVADISANIDRRTMSSSAVDHSKTATSASEADQRKRALAESLAVNVRDDPTAVPHLLVGQLSLRYFKFWIKKLASFGDRSAGSLSYGKASNWLQARLTQYGYKVQRAYYWYGNQRRYSLYVDKIGRTKPDQMYIVSAHLDGRGGGGAANDDASGCALVLEMARVMARRDFFTSYTVRFIFWNNEETGLNGSRGYVNSRKQIQGIEQPAGSGEYPEPKWLGIVQHDQILFDHGWPLLDRQSPNADSDIEYKAGSKAAVASRQLALELQKGNAEYAERYPAEVSDAMSSTDSVPFQDYTASVSIRENKRLAELGQGAQPHWHQPTDVYETYSELDYKFGFDILRTTAGTIAKLAGTKARLGCICYRKIRAQCRDCADPECGRTLALSSCQYLSHNKKRFVSNMHRRYARNCGKRGLG